MLDICKLGDEILRCKATDIEKIDSSLSVLADAMFETMYEANGVGLAGPQIGVDKRIFVIDIGNGDKYCFINPVILTTTDDECLHEEGCLSIPGVYAKIRRPSGLKVQARNLEGKLFTLEADGLLARAIFHEYDHLDGKLFIDKMAPEDRAFLLKQYESRNKKGRRKK